MKQLLIIASFFIGSIVCAQDKKQCAAKTKAGTQCMHKTTAQFCKVHDPATPRCGADTKSGTKCKLVVKVAGTRCHHHKTN